MKNKRKQYILTQLEKNPYVRVADLERELHVTPMTIRRDLKELDQEGKLLRVHGGAQALPTHTRAIQEPCRDALAVKRAAQQAAELVKEGDTIFIGAGEICRALVDALPYFNLHVVTNSMNAFNRLRQNPKITCTLLGGRYDEECDAFYGSITLTSLQSLQFDKAFVEASAIVRDKLFASREDEAMVKEAALNHSSLKYGLCTSAAFASVPAFAFYSLDMLDDLITGHQTGTLTGTVN